MTRRRRIAPVPLPPPAFEFHRLPLRETDASEGDRVGVFGAYSAPNGDVYLLIGHLDPMSGLPPITDTDLLVDYLVEDGKLHPDGEFETESFHARLFSIEIGEEAERHRYRYRRISPMPYAASFAGRRVRPLVKEPSR